LQKTTTNKTTITTTAQLQSGIVSRKLVSRKNTITPKPSVQKTYTLHNEKQHWFQNQKPYALTFYKPL